LQELLQSKRVTYLGTTCKHSFGQWTKRLGTSTGRRTSPEASTAELLGFLVLQERQNKRLAREPEGGYDLRHSGRFLGVSIVL